MSFYISRRFYANSISQRFAYRRKLAKEKEQKKEKPYEKAISEFLTNRQPTIGVDEWSRLRQSLSLKDQNPSRLDTTILKHLVYLPTRIESLEHCKQYFKALNALDVKPSLPNYDYLVQSYCRKREECDLTVEEKTELADACKMIMEKTGMHLPSSLMLRVVDGLCQTDEWKQSLGLLHNVERVNAGRIAQNKVVAKAFTEGEIDLGFRLLESVVSVGSELTDDSCDAYWTYCEQQGTPHLIENIERMLKFWETKGTIVSRDCVEKLHELVDKFGGQSHFTKINEEGICGICESRLDAHAVSAEDFHALQEVVTTAAMVTDNVYLKSMPDEVKRFNEYIDQISPYDVVVDGFNVAFIATNASPSIPDKASRLAEVVSQFADRGKSVLVIGRKNMEHWPREPMDIVRKKGFFFPVDIRLYDDIFTMYAALYSGPKTQIVTNDARRTHALMNTHGTQISTTFARWQLVNHLQMHQNASEGARFTAPINHRLCCHKSNGFWHIPCNYMFTSQMADRIKIEALHWSCIQLPK